MPLARYRINHGDKQHLRETWKNCNKLQKKEFLDEYKTNGGDRGA